MIEHLHYVLALCLPFLPHVIGYLESEEYNTGVYGPSPNQTFISSNSTPVAWNWNIFPSSPSILNHNSNNSVILLAPRGVGVQKPGPYLFTPTGDLIWDGSEYGQTMSFIQDMYKGSPVLGFWVGEFNPSGYGFGRCLLLDEEYKVVANISTPTPNESIDFHELTLTTNGTALIVIYGKAPYNFTTYLSEPNNTIEGSDGNDITKGWIMPNYVQEIDIETGKEVFIWNSIDHVDPKNCYAGPGSTGLSEDKPWDYFHINSVDKDSKGNYLVSSRHCHAIFYVSGTTGEILWTIGSKNSTFIQNNGTVFSWQHDARWRNNETQISLFDNDAAGWTEPTGTARGILLDIDIQGKSVNLAQEYLPWNRTVSDSQGNMEVLDNGNVLIGWGQNPYFSEYSPNGTLLWSVQFGASSQNSAVQAYRAERGTWSARPTSLPSAKLITNGSNPAIYVSWNGATEVSTWEVFSSDTRDGSFAVVDNSKTPKTNFETMIPLPIGDGSGNKWYQVEAKAVNGTVLGRSGSFSKDQDSSTSDKGGTGGSGNNSNSASLSRSTLGLGTGLAVFIAMMMGSLWL